MQGRGKKSKGKLEKHFSSQAHKSAVADYAHFMLSSRHTETLLEKTKRTALIEEEKLLSRNKEIVEILLDVTRTLGRQGLAFRGSEDEEKGNFWQIVQLVARHNGVLNYWMKNSKLRPYQTTYMSWRSQNEFIQLVGEHVRNEILKEITESPFFCLMADRTPDSSNKDMLTVVIRTVDDDCKPRERLLEIAEAKDKTGLGTASQLMGILNSHQIRSSDLTFQSYDFASSMSGQFNGTQRKISDIVDHEVTFIPCQAHRTNTAVEHCCTASTIVSELFNILEELYVFFSSSTKRANIYKDQTKEIENSLQLKNLSKTRWTTRAESIQAVSISFEAIASLLEIISKSPSLVQKLKQRCTTC